MPIKIKILFIFVLLLVVACGQLDDDSAFKFETFSYDTSNGDASFTLSSSGEDSQYMVIPVSHTAQASQNVYTLSSGDNNVDGSGGGVANFTRTDIPLRMQIEHRFRLIEKQIVQSDEIYNFVEHKQNNSKDACTSDISCDASEFCDAGTCRSELELNFTNPETMEYEQVTAIVKRVSSISVIVVDQSVSDSIDQNDIENIGRVFDSVVYPRDTFFFGKNLNRQDLDVDSNGKIIIFMTPKLNSVEGFAGLFNAMDLVKRGPNNPASNERDMFYVVVPDDDNPLSLIYATLAHEFQHMLNFSIRALSRARDGQTPVYENVWLNEGLSHLAEDLVGYGKDAPAFVKKYIEEPAEHTLQFSDSNADADNPGNRGMAYMYLRYLFEQKGAVEYGSNPDELTDNGGASFLNTLYVGDKKGLDNLSSAIGENYKSTFHDWLITVAIAGKSLTDDSKYNYKDTFKDPVTDFVHGVSLFGSVDTSAGPIELNGVSVDVFESPADRYTTGTGADFLRVNAASDVDLNFSSDVLSAFTVLVVRTN